ncbi:MAG: hypothetical protein U0802_08740 [Candidatus Binatia bacterium]
MTESSAAGRFSATRWIRGVGCEVRVGVPIALPVALGVAVLEPPAVALGDGVGVAVAPPGLVGRRVGGTAQ